jgi:hypothetical protein
MAVKDKATLKGYFNTSDIPTEDQYSDLIDSSLNNILSITNVDDTYVVLDTDEWIRCDGTFTVTLPPATGSGRAIVIMNVGAGVITVDGDGAETINGAITQTVLSLIGLTVVDVGAGIWDAS